MSAIKERFDPYCGWGDNAVERTVSTKCPTCDRQVDMRLVFGMEPLQYDLLSAIAELHEERTGCAHDFIASASRLRKPRTFA